MLFLKLLIYEYQIRPDTAEMESAYGKYSPSGPQCMIKQYGGRRDGRCLDIPGEHVELSGLIQVYPCMNKWNQMFGFSLHGKRGSIHLTLPSHLLSTKERTRFIQERNICLGASGRGDTIYEAWREDQNRLKLNATDFAPEEEHLMKFRDDSSTYLPLSFWENKFLVTVPCSDEKAVLDFIFVPFIEEEESLIIHENYSDEF